MIIDRSKISIRPIDQYLRLTELIVNGFKINSIDD